MRTRGRTSRQEYPATNREAMAAQTDAGVCRDASHCHFYPECLPPIYANRAPTAEPCLVPENFLCPFTRNVFRDPVVASDGGTYERAAIEAWLQRGHARSPLTGEKLAHLTVIPNLGADEMARHIRATSLAVEERVARAVSDVNTAVLLRERAIGALPRSRVSKVKRNLRRAAPPPPPPRVVPLTDSCARVAAAAARAHPPLGARARERVEPRGPGRGASVPRREAPGHACGQLLQLQHRRPCAAHGHGGPGGDRQLGAHGLHGATFAAGVYSASSPRRA